MNKMMDNRQEIYQQFNRIAEEYDVNRRKFIPCFDEFYKETTAFIARCIGKPMRILDLGAGTGLLTAFWSPTNCACSIMQDSHHLHAFTSVPNLQLS